MRCLYPIVASLAIVLGLVGCSIMGPVMEAQRETLERVEQLQERLEDAQAEARAIQERYAAGEIDAAERDDQLAAVRSEVLAGLAAIRDALAATGAAIEGLGPEDVAREIQRTAPLLPPPFDSLAAIVASLLGAYGISRRGDRRVQEERDAARALRGEPVQLAPATARRPFAHEMQPTGSGAPPTTRVDPGTAAVRRALRR